MRWMLRVLAVVGSGLVLPALAQPRSESRPPRLLTEDEIQRLRWMEFDDRDEPRPLAVQFTNNVIDRFLGAMEGHHQYSSDDDRRRFRTASPNEKIRAIRQDPVMAEKFAGDVIIKSDPWRLSEFERRVMPIVLGGCATARCHGSPTQNPFVLYNDSLMNTPRVYTNYYILHEYEVGGKSLIDRLAPERSLLLTYGLKELSPNLDPSYKHPTEIKPFFRGPGDPRYRTIFEWIQSLSTIRPDYKISLEESPGTPASP